MRASFILSAQSINVCESSGCCSTIHASSSFMALCRPLLTVALDTCPSSTHHLAMNPRQLWHTMRVVPSMLIGSPSGEAQHWHCERRAEHAGAANELSRIASAAFSISAFILRYLFFVSSSLIADLSRSETRLLVVGFSIRGHPSVFHTRTTPCALQSCYAGLEDTFGSVSMCRVYRPSPNHALHQNPRPALRSKSQVHSCFPFRSPPRRGSVSLGVGRHGV
jgi:hypothetical protein